MVNIFSDSVTCAEVYDDLQSEQYDRDSGWSAQVTLICPFEDRHTLVSEIVGGRKSWPGLTLDISPRAKSAGIRPLPTASPSSADLQAFLWQYSLVTINYETTFQNEDEEGDIFSESLEPAVEFQLQDYNRFRWTGQAGKRILEGEAPGKLVYSLAIVRTIYELAALPEEVLTCLGHVNDADYTSDILGLTFVEESLLFEPGAPNRTIKSDGSGLWTLPLKFVYKPETWNKYWRAETSAYESMYDLGDPGPYKSYPTADFSAVLF